jgi:hypothetical protein
MKPKHLLMVLACLAVMVLSGIITARVAIMVWLLVAPLAIGNSRRAAQARRRARPFL